MGTDSSRHRVDDVDSPGRFCQPQRPRWYTPVGRALFLGSDTQRDTGFYSDARLHRLLAARGSTLRCLLARMFRMAAASGVRFNWREMARFILSEGYDKEAPEWSRRGIAREYYRAERQSSIASN